MKTNHIIKKMYLLRIVGVWCVPALFIIVCLPNVAAASRYIFTLFTNSSESNMYIYQSADALNYTCIKGPAYTPPSGLVRDPSIIKHTDGHYYIAYTTNWEGANFGIASSTDLKTWTFVTNVDVNVADIKNTWAPEWFIDSDGSVNIIVSLRTNSSSYFMPYHYRALNSSLTSWSSGTPLSGLEPNYIDTFIVKVGSTYHAFTKNETTKYIEHATASSLTGPYTFVGTDDWAGWGNWIEGPALIRLDNGDWRIYFDKYTSPTGYYYSDSSDLTSWTAKTALPGGLSGFVRHGTVLKEDADLMLSDGEIRSWESYNFPNYFVRHTGVGNAVRIDPNVNPVDDKRFVMAPGLADPNGVSFESVNNPGHYLRHWDYNLRLDAYNGTQVFKEDATFYQRPGLADSGWTSFESYNFSGYYIRHYAYVLRIEQISGGTAQQDATFRFIGDGPTPTPTPGGGVDAEVTIDGNGAGRIFDGIGMVNSSGTSKLLQNYPSEQQQDILDFLFKPNFGASLTRMRNEIGGDINSSSGTEPSHQRTETETPTARGVNFWIAREARDRNADIQFIGSRWGIPAWANASDANKRDYYLSYLQVMGANGTPLDYLSPEENEGAFDRDYVVNTLKPALDAAGYSSLKLIARDAYQSWAIADQIQSDAALKNILAGINNHYVTTSTTNALNCGLPLYNDEADTPMRDWWERMMFAAINNAKQYVDGKMVRILYQPALDSIYDTIKYSYKGILTANTPWSGYYEVHPALWMTAHYTQFAKPGWKFLDSGCGSVDSNNYYITLRDQNTSDYSIILVNAGSTATEYSFHVNGGLSTGAVHVWRTTQSEQFIQQTDITPTGNTFSISIPAQSIYSLTTTTGQHKGAPTYTIPANTVFSLPYMDNFSSYTAGQQPNYTHDQVGAFEVVDVSGQKYLQQMITTPPIEWGGGTSGRSPYTVLGDPRWVNYQVSADVLLTTSGAALVSGRGNLHNRDSNVPPTGYQLQLWPSGNWYFRKVVFGTITDFANGTLAGFNLAEWHNLKVTMNGTIIQAYIDGIQVVDVIDMSLSSGQVALGSSNYTNVGFANLKIEPISVVTPVSGEKLDDKDSSIHYSSGWANENGAWQNYFRSLHMSNTANASLEHTFFGTEVTILGRQAANCGQADIYIDDIKQTTIDTYNSTTRYRSPLYQKTGLVSGSHTVKLVVSGNKNTMASDAYIYVDSIETLDGTGAMPTPTPTPMPTELIVNDNTTGTGNNQFEYVGSWSYGAQSGAYQDDNHWEGDTDGYYQVRFLGTQIKIYAAKAPNHGIAAVSIDGGAETDVDFYASSREEQALVYTSPVLSEGQHILKVRVTGTKNPASTGVVIPADRVDITDEAATPTPSTGTMENGQPMYTTTSELVHAHGGGMIKVGDYYYWFGENRNADDTFYAVSCYRSQDLKTWEFRNHVLTQDSATELAAAKIERPKVVYNQATGKFVMWMHKENAENYSEARAAVASSGTVDGNYTYHGSFRPLDYMSRDCTLFVDDDESAYFISAANNNADLHLYKLTPDYLNVESLVQKLWVGEWREAPAMFKRNGYYFLVTSGCTGWDPNQARYGYATSISGTWSDLYNLGDATTYRSQPYYILPVQGTIATTYLYMGDRWAGAWGRPVVESKYVWLPLQFPSDTSLALDYADFITIDVATGVITPSTEWTKVDDGHSSVSYSAGWGTWSGNPGYQQTEHYSEITGSEATLTFNGTQARYYGMKRDDLGEAEIYVDEVLKATVDCYQSTPLYDWLLYDTGTLPVGIHTLKIIVKGTKNAASSGTEVIVDAFVFQSTVEPTPTPTAVPTPMDVVLFDDFEDGEAGGWTTEGGSWAVIADGDTLVWDQTSTAEAFAYRGDPSWTDYAYEARLKPTSGDAWTGILGRVQDTQNFYLFKLEKADNNTITLEKRVNGVGSTIATATYPIQQGQWYTLKMVFSGSTITCSIDGEVKIVATDTSFSTGIIGFRSKWGTERFDDVMVSVPAPPATPTPTEPPEFTPTPDPSGVIPEPTTLTLFGLGLAGLLMIRRCWRKRR